MIDACALDYGHGGFVGPVYQTAGKRYRFTDHAFEAYEGKINRAVYRMIRHLMARTCADPLLVDVVQGGLERRAGLPLQYDVSLQSRVEWANQAWEAYGAPLVSIHTNAAGNADHGRSKSPRGISVFTSPGDTESDRIASRLVAAFKVMEKDGGLPVRPGDWSDGDPDHEARFYLLTKTRGPAVLVEGGWFTNWQDVSVLNTHRGLDRLAAGYVLGLVGEDVRTPEAELDESWRPLDVRTGYLPRPGGVHGA